MDAVAVCHSSGNKIAIPVSVLITVLMLALLSACQSEANVPSSTPTPVPSLTASLTSQDSPPSVSWSNMLTTAKAKVSSVYTNAILTSVLANPYDYNLSPGYAPATEILHIEFTFMCPGPILIHLNLADDDPVSTMRLSMDDYSRSDTARDVFQEMYDRSLKDQPRIERGINAISLTPRDVINRTHDEARERADQVGLGAQALIPDVSFKLSDSDNGEWVVTYRLNPMEAGGQLDLKKPVATFTVDTESGSIVSKQFDDGKPALSDLYSTPGMTATMQAAATAMVGAAPTQITSKPTPTSAQQAFDDGKTQEIRGNNDLAIELYNQAISLDPNYTDAYLARGIIYNRNNEYDLGIADFTKVIALEPGIKEAWTNRASAYIHRGDSDASKRELDLAVQDLNHAISIDPTDSGAYAFRALAYYYKSDYDKAIADYSEAIKDSPDDFDSVIGRGMSYAAEKQWDNAIKDYDQYIKNGPNTQRSLAYYERGIADEYKLNYETAINDYTEALRLAPNYAEAYIGLGESYYELGDYTHAITDSEKASTLRPQDMEPHYWSGVAMRRNGDADGAINELNRAIEIAPQYAPAYVARGTAYLDKTNYDQAMIDFNKAIELKSDYTWAFVIRGIAYGFQHNYDKAMADFDKALQIGNDDAGAYYGQGKVYAMQGEKDKAAADFEKALEINKDPVLARDIESEQAALEK